MPKIIKNGAIYGTSPSFGTDIVNDPSISTTQSVAAAIAGKQDVIAQGGVTSLDANTLYGSKMTKTYRCTNSSISNVPENDGTLIVVCNGDGYSTVQLFFNYSGTKSYMRTTWGAGSVSWNSWVTIATVDKLVSVQLSYSATDNYFPIPNTTPVPKTVQTSVLGRNMSSGHMYALWYDEPSRCFRISAVINGSGTPSDGNKITVQYIA